MKWREREKALGRVIYRNTKLSSVFVVLIMILVGFTAIFIVLPSTVKAEGPDPPYETKTVWITSSKATYLRERNGYENTNYGNSEVLWVDPQFTAILTERRCRSVVYMDISDGVLADDGTTYLYFSDFPSSSYIVSAELNLYYDSFMNGNPIGRSRACWELNCDWTEGTGGGTSIHASWEHDTSTSDWNFDWRPPSERGDGGSYRDINGDETLDSSGDMIDEVIVGGTDEWHKWDVTASVRRFVDGTNNYGWLIDDKNEGSSAGQSFNTVYKSDDAASDKPKLKIVYRVPEVPTAQSNAPANVYTGGLQCNGEVADDGDGNPLLEYVPCQYNFYASRWAVLGGYTLGYTAGWVGSLYDTEPNDFSTNLNFLQSGKHGWYRACVRHRTDEDNVSQGSIQHFLTKPSDITNFQATAIDSNRIDLSWTNGAGGVSAYIEFAIGTPPFPWNPGARTKIPRTGLMEEDGYAIGESYSHTGLNPGTRYFYKAWSYASHEGYRSDGTAAFPFADNPLTDDATTPGGGGGSKPSFDRVTIVWPDVNNCYPKIPVTVEVEITHPESFEMMTDVDIFLGPNLEVPMENTTWVKFNYNIGSRRFSIDTEVGTIYDQWHIEEAACSFDQVTATRAVLLFCFYKDTWEITPEVEHLDLVLHCIDMELNEKYANYFDTFDFVNQIVPNTFAFTDERVDVGGSVTANFQINFVDNPGSTTPSTTPVLGSEFNEIRLLDEEDSTVGLDETISGDGSGSINFNAPSSVPTYPDTYDYDLYFDMIDPNAPTGEETTRSISLITDEIVIGSFTNDSGDGRVNIGDTVNFTISNAKLAYDDHPLGSSDTMDLNVSGASSSWVTDHWEISYSGEGLGRKAITVSALESTYGISAIQSATTTHNVIWDQIWVEFSLFEDSVIDTGEEATFNFFSIKYAYDDQPLSSYTYTVSQILGLGGETKDYTYSSQDSFNIKPKKSGVYTFSLSSISEDTYGLTARNNPGMVQLTVNQTINLNEGVNYITWGNSSITPKHFAENFSLSYNDVVGKYDNENGGWDTYTYQVGTDIASEEFTSIDRWDHLRVTSLEGETSASFPPDSNTDEDYQETMDMNYGDGYGYMTWTKGESITASEFMDTVLTNNGLSTNSNIEITVYNSTQDQWLNYNAKWSPFATLDKIYPYDVIIFRAPSKTIDYDSTWFG